jgi:hypothetical protein
MSKSRVLQRATATRAAVQGAPGPTAAGPAAGKRPEVAPSFGDLEHAARLGHHLAEIPLHAAVPAAPQAGRPLPEPLRARMEASFGRSFAPVRVHEDRSVAALGASAFARGHDVHFAPGRYQPDTRSGQALIGHELAHVVQQSAGVVAASTGEGAPINADPHLEAEADTQGARAARGEVATVRGTGGGVQPKAGAGVVQCAGDEDFRRLLRRSGQRPLHGPWVPSGAHARAGRASVSHHARAIAYRGGAAPALAAALAAPVPAPAPPAALPAAAPPAALPAAAPAAAAAAALPAGAPAAALPAADAAVLPAVAPAAALPAADAAAPPAADAALPAADAAALPALAPVAALPAANAAALPAASAAAAAAAAAAPAAAPAVPRTFAQQFQRGDLVYGVTSSGVAAGSGRDPYVDDAMAQLNGRPAMLDRRSNADAQSYGIRIGAGHDRVVPLTADSINNRESRQPQELRYPWDDSVDPMLEEYRRQNEGVGRRDWRRRCKRVLSMAGDGAGGPRMHFALDDFDTTQAAVPRAERKVRGRQHTDSHTSAELRKTHRLMRDRPNIRIIAYRGKQEVGFPWQVPDPAQAAARQQQNVAASMAAERGAWADMDEDTSSDGSVTSSLRRARAASAPPAPAAASAASSVLASAAGAAAAAAAAAPARAALPDDSSARLAAIRARAAALRGAAVAPAAAAAASAAPAQQDDSSARLAAIRARVAALRGAAAAPAAAAPAAAAAASAAPRPTYQGDVGTYVASIRDWLRRS